MGRTLRVELLGSLTIDTGDGVPTGLPSATQRRLLSVLALEVGHVVSTNRLCELLGCGAGALRTSVSRLRAAVGSDHLSTAPPGYVLTASTDVSEFEQLVSGSGSASSTSAIETLDRALGLWGGEPLEEFTDEFWAVAVVERLRELHAFAVESRAEAMLLAQRSDVVIAEMRQHAALHPLRERPCSILMRALAVQGRSTEALRVYQEHRRHLVDVAGTEPSALLRDLERSIAAGDAAGSADDTRGASPGSARFRSTNLPAQRTTLIGREALVDTVCTLVAEHRLVSLIGPGGVGKTRLAIESAKRSLDVVPGGVFFVDLTAATAPADVTGVLARSLKVPIRSTGSDADAVADFLSGRTCLLVMDNCEHVIAAAAEVIDDLLVGTDDARVLATTREPLRLHGERRLIVESLGVDGDDSAGAQLFADRASAVDESVDRQVLRDRSQTISEVVRRLDGIPLAIELAAAQTASFTIEEILDALDDRFSIPAEHQRRVPLRQQTLAATVQWSYDLLDADQRAAFRSLSACAGAFSALTASRILGRTRAETDRQLADLQAKSLLVAVSEAGEPIAYNFLETLREYGRARAALEGETDAAVIAVEAALLPPVDVATDWTRLVNDVICGADPAVMLEATTRLAAAGDAQEQGRLRHAAFIFASVALRDDVGVLRARASTVRTLAGRRAELDPMAWRAANAATLLFERSGRDYGAVLSTAAEMTSALEPDDPARCWFDLWRCALITAVDPVGGLTAVDAALPVAQRNARPPLDWTLSQFLGTKATGLALVRRLDEALPVAAEAARWAPVGQESRDQILALRAWLGYLAEAPADSSLVAEIAAQPHDLGLAELCAAPGVLRSGGTPEQRGERLSEVARRRPEFDIPTPFLLAFAWLAIERGEIERARRLVAHAELFDASTAVALVHAVATIDGWADERWASSRDTTVAHYLGPEQELAAELGNAELAAELDRWERLTGRRSGAGAAGPRPLS